MKFDEAAECYFIERNDTMMEHCEKQARFYRKAKQNAIEMKLRFEKMEFKD